MLENFIPIKNLISQNLDQIGQRGKDLAQFIRLKIPTIDGFVIPPNALAVFIKKTQIETTISDILSRINIHDPSDLYSRTVSIKNTLKEQEDVIEQNLIDSKIIGKKKHHLQKVLTSSIINGFEFTNDNQDFAKSTKDLSHQIAMGWAKNFMPRSLLFKYSKNIDLKVPIAALILENVKEAENSGHLILDSKNIFITAILGEEQKEMETFYDIYHVIGAKIKKNYGFQTNQLIWAKNELVSVPIANPYQNKQKINSSQIKALVQIAQKLQKEIYFRHIFGWTFTHGKITLHSSLAYASKEQTKTITAKLDVHTNIASTLGTKNGKQIENYIKAPSNLTVKKTATKLIANVDDFKNISTFSSLNIDGFLIFFDGDKKHFNLDKLREISNIYSNITIACTNLEDLQWIKDTLQDSHSSDFKVAILTQSNKKPGGKYLKLANTLILDVNSKKFTKKELQAWQKISQKYNLHLAAAINSQIDSDYLDLLIRCALTQIIIKTDQAISSRERIYQMEHQLLIK